MLLALAVLTWVTMMLGLVAERVLAVEEVGNSDGYLNRYCHRPYQYIFDIDTVILTCSSISIPSTSI
jgi:hypothetical protein